MSNSVPQELNLCRAHPFGRNVPEVGTAGFPNAIVVVVWEGMHPGPEEVTPNSHSTSAVKT